jgi:outer membrane lipoprotein-sorting protein
MITPTSVTQRRKGRQSGFARYKLRTATFLGFIAMALMLIGAPDAAAQAGDLEKVLSSMDNAAVNFHSAKVDFAADLYEAVVKEHTNQKGFMYIRKAGGKIEMYADFNIPADQRKQVLFKDGEVQLYNPIAKTKSCYNAEKNKEAFQSFLVLGFGSRGHDLDQQFAVKYGGAEDVSGIKTAKLELTPKSARVRNMFDRIVLWIDSRGLSVQQQFLQSSGDYRLVQYSNIAINESLPHDAFKLKTTGKTTVVNGPCN